MNNIPVIIKRNLVYWRHQQRKEIVPAAAAREQNA